MIVTITIRQQPRKLVISSSMPGATLSPARPLYVTVSMVRDGAKGDKGEPGDAATNNTLELVRLADNKINGDIDANGTATMVNIRPGVESNEPMTVGQGNEVYSSSKSYTDDKFVESKDYADTKHQDAIGYADDITLDKTRIVDNKITGNIDANGHTIENLLNGVNPQEAATVAQVQAAIAQANAYSDNVSSMAVRFVGYWDPTGGLYPSGYPGGIKFGYYFEADNATPVIMPNGEEIQKGDKFTARITNPGQNAANWLIGQGNIEQGTESKRGTFFRATTAEAQNENTTDNVGALTSTTGWQMLARFVAIARTITGLWTFNLSPRVNTLSSGQYVKAGASKELITVSAIPVADITEDTNKVFVMPSEKALITSTAVIVSTHTSQIASLTTQASNNAAAIATLQNDMLSREYMFIMSTQWHYVVANLGVATFNIVSGNGFVVSNGPTARSYADTFYGRNFRTGLVTAATANSQSGIRQTTGYMTRAGGFNMYFKFGFSENATLSNIRAYVGFGAPNATPGNTSPSAFTNCVILGRDDGSLNLKLFNNDSTVGAVVTDLGANFPANTIETDVYLCNIRTIGTTTIEVTVWRIGTTNIFTIQLTTRIPATNYVGAFLQGISNNTNAAACGFDFMQYEARV